MRQNRSGSFSPKKPTRRSGSTTTAPEPGPGKGRGTIQAAPPPPPLPTAAPLPPPPAPPARSYHPKALGLLVLLAAFVAVHILVDLLLDLAPADTLGAKGLRLLEIFLFWAPILFLGIFLGLGLGHRFPVLIRLGALLAFAALVAFFGYLATDVPEGARSCNLDANQAHCLSAGYFDLLLRLSPIPVFFFLFATGRHRWTVGQCFGLTLAIFTLWRGVYFSFPDLLVIAGGGAVLGPTPAIEFYRNFFLKALWEVGYIVLGLFFIFRRVPGLHKPFTWGNELESVLRPLGAWTRHSVKLDVAWGLTTFVPLAISASLLTFLLQQGPTGSVGDDSRVFEEMTLDLVFLLAIAAGVGEELVFRGFLQSAFERMMPFPGWPRAGLWLVFVGAASALLTGTYMVLFVDVVDGILVGIGIGSFFGVVAMVLGWGGFGAAILLQALVFGLVHAGYGDLDHLILPLMFGLLAGIIYRLFGLLAIILIHVEIDVFAFAGSYTGAFAAPLDAFLGILFVAQIGFAIVFTVFRLLGWFESRRRLVPVIVRS